MVELVVVALVVVLVLLRALVRGLPLAPLFLLLLSVELLSVLLSLLLQFSPVEEVVVGIIEGAVIKVVGVHIVDGVIDAIVIRTRLVEIRLPFFIRIFLAFYRQTVDKLQYVVRKFCLPRIASATLVIHIAAKLLGKDEFPLFDGIEPRLVLKKVGEHYIKSLF